MFECTRARWWNSQIPGFWSNWDYRAGLAQNSPSTREGVHSRRWSLRVALVIVFLVVLVLFVLFVFFFVWLFSNEDMGSYRTIRGFWVDVFCSCPMVRLVPLGKHSDKRIGREACSSGSGSDPDVADLGRLCSHIFVQRRSVAASVSSSQEEPS